MRTTQRLMLAPLATLACASLALAGCSSSGTGESGSAAGEAGAGSAASPAVPAEAESIPGLPEGYGEMPLPAGPGQDTPGRVEVGDGWGTALFAGAQRVVLGHPERGIAVEYAPPNGLSPMAAMPFGDDVYVWESPTMYSETLPSRLVKLVDGTAPEVFGNTQTDRAEGLARSASELYYATQADKRTCIHTLERAEVWCADDIILIDLTGHSGGVSFIALDAVATPPCGTLNYLADGESEPEVLNGEGECVRGGVGTPSASVYSAVDDNQRDRVVVTIDGSESLAGAPAEIGVPQPVKLAACGDRAGFRDGDGVTWVQADGELIDPADSAISYAGCDPAGQPFFRNTQNRGQKLYAAGSPAVSDNPWSTPETVTAPEVQP